MPDPQELEGKFACRSEDLQRVLALESIGDFQLVQRAERTQTDIYYDTADLALRRQSCSLRQRSIGETVKATFKGPRQAVENAEGAAHLVKRLELEVPVVPPPAGEQEFLDRLDLEPIHRARGLVASGERLGPIARIVTHRRMLNYRRDDGGEVELSLDDVRATDLRTDRRTVIVEVELELIDGDAGTLINAADSLRRAIPTLHPSAASKLARALGETPETISSQ